MSHLLQQSVTLHCVLMDVVRFSEIISLQHWKVYLCSGQVLHFLCGTDWILNHYLNICFIWSNKIFAGKL
jgi:hypothetical protein